MGNDIAVFQEGELEESFYRYHGPKNESWSEFFSRTYSGIMNMLIQPKRFQYRTHDLINNSHCSGSNNNHEDIDESSYKVNEFNIMSSDQLLHCATWIENSKSKLWFLYLHTNTRSLADAPEILPLCSLLGANLLSFDLPGCGKSQGNLSFSMVSDLAAIINYFTSTYPNCELVIWARGMSTALIIEYLNGLQGVQTENSEGDNRTAGDSVVASTIKYVVLDSPFLSVKKMVADASQTITAYGITVPSTVVSFCSSFIRRSVKSKLGCDPYDVKPVNFVPNMTVPCSILSARSDDYMPPHHGQSIFEVWGQSIQPRPYCEFEVYEGRHFGLREKELVCKPLNSILNYVNYRPQTIEEQFLTESQLMNLTSPMNGVFLFGGNGMLRIPSNSSLASKGAL